MKAVLFSDNLNSLHLTMLKSVLLVLSLLPVSHFILDFWQTVEGSSQIMVGFFATSLIGALVFLSFWAALKTSAVELTMEIPNRWEECMLKLYRHLPMSVLAVILSYLSVQL